MTIMAKKNENIAEETVKKTTKKAKTEGEAVEKTEEEIYRAQVSHHYIGALR